MGIKDKVKAALGLTTTTETKETKPKKRWKPAQQKPARRRPRNAPRHPKAWRKHVKRHGQKTKKVKVDPVLAGFHGA